MFGFLKNKTLPIGVDLGTGHLKMAQLGTEGDNVFLQAAACEPRPADIAPGTAQWQRWVSKAVKSAISSKGFKGKSVMTAMPADDVFIDQVRIARSLANSLDQATLAKVQQKLPFDPAKAVVKYVVTENGSSSDDLDVVVMVTEREKVERNLAIYEKAGLQVRGMTVWPLAITTSYAQFFGRRESDTDTTALLLEMGAHHSNAVICRQTDLLFARSIPVGYKLLAESGPSNAETLISETNSCCRYFESVSGGSRIERLVVLAREDIDQDLCHQIADFAQKMQVSAQIGDVVQAVETRPGANSDISMPQVDWAIAYGLSLSGAKQLQAVS
nr:pilus assembly protein PilM [Anaerohalosphaera lusitana]